MTEAHVDPTRAQFERFKDLDRTTPIEMLNLIRFRDEAAYPEDHPNFGVGLSGAEAYRLYGQASAPVLARVGGSILWRGTFETTLIGPDDERWDASFIALYPNARAFLAMVTDPEYQQAVVHRQAGVATSRLLRHGALPDSAQFG